MSVAIVRGAKETLKLAVTSNTAIYPVGTVTGDLLIAMVCAFGNTATPPTVATPSGWVQRGPSVNTGTLDATTGRNVYLFSGVAGEGGIGTASQVFTASAECVKLIVCIIGIQKGTWSVGVPFDVLASAWVTEVSAAESHLPTINTANAEDLAIEFISAASGGPTMVTAGWTEPINTGTNSIGYRTAQSAEAVTGTYKKSVAKYSAAFLVGVNGVPSTQAGRMQVVGQSVNTASVI